ncbi:acyltransferase family protein [Sphingobacterium oryzagri]|uniref:acyltransferase family protein n=1 Tax=Sphingobacterium oryzagri TaxID=3025669 RepID=UPI003D182760
MVCFHINVGYLSKYADFVYSFHMPAFLLLSGLFLSLNNDLKPWFIKLFRGLVIPYVFFELLYVVCLYVIGRFGINFSNKIDELDISTISKFLFVNPIGAFWYFHTLIICTSIIYFIHKFVKLDLLSRTIIFLIISWCIDNFLISGFRFENSLFFIMGYFFSKSDFTIPPSLLSILAIVLIFFNGDHHRGNVESISTTILIISFLTAFYRYLPSTTFTKTFTYFGRNTLIIVLIHPIFINFFKMFQKFFYEFDNTLIIYSVVNSLLTISLCLLSAYVMDYIGISKVLFGKKIYSKYLA